MREEETSSLRVCFHFVVQSKSAFYILVWELKEINRGVSSLNSSPVAARGKNVYFSEMIRFPIEWKLKYENIRYSSTLCLDLNDEWTLSCTWKDRPDGKLLDFIAIRRKTNLETTSLCGTFSILVKDQKVLAQTFSQLMESGSKFTKLIDVHEDQNLPELHSFRPPQDLHGVINIISVSDKCTSNFVTSSCKIYYQQKSLVQLSDDFGRLLDPETSCNTDVNLKCGSASIPAHKLILSARSPVFAAMFKNQMKESHKNEVDITDIEASVFQAMVTYIYSGQTSGLTVSSASDLLFAADKYQLLDLKRVCCEFLKESISMRNVMKFLNLGDMHDEDLKSFSVEYLCKIYTNFEEFEILEEWENLRKQKPTLAVDVLESILKSKDQKKL